MSESKSKSPKVFDVAKPGKTAASATSKPIIVSNHPVLKDPMVVEDDKPSDKEAEAPLAPPSETRLKVEPITPDLKPDEPDAPDAKPEEDKATDTAEAEINDSIDKPKPNADNEDLAARKAAERQAELDKIAESRKYYLPINQVGKRRSRQYSIMGVVLIIILGLAWADVALDAGIINIGGIKAPTHFFK